RARVTRSRAASPPERAAAEEATRANATLAAPAATQRVEAAPQIEQTPPRPTDALALEIALLRDARAALQRHDARKALALTEEYAERFANGTMRQEQIATRALALCALGRRADAIAAKRELERIAPRSPHLMQLRASCATGDNAHEVQ